MSRYIDANLLKAEFTGDFTRAYAVSLIKRIIDQQPTADVQEVRHGKWQLQPVGIGYCWECSVCHMNPRFYSMENTKYCPNCGAKMDLED